MPDLSFSFEIVGITPEDQISANSAISDQKQFQILPSTGTDFLANALTINNFSLIGEQINTDICQPFTLTVGSELSSLSFPVAAIPGKGLSYLGLYDQPQSIIANAEILTIYITDSGNYGGGSAGQNTVYIQVQGPYWS